VGRLHTEPVAAPFAPALERATFPNVANIAKGIKATLEGKPPIPIRLSLELARKNNPRASVSQTPVAAKPVAAAPAPAAAQPAPAPAAPAAAANSSLIPVNVPNIDLTITEARVVRWLKNVGDAVTEGEGLLEVETDKSVVEIESPAAGRLARIIAPAETIVKLMECVAEIDPS
jgi:biotin carboxyl carrier protein